MKTVWIVSSEHPEGYMAVFSNKAAAQLSAARFSTETRLHHDVVDWVVHKDALKAATLKLDIEVTKYAKESK